MSTESDAGEGAAVRIPPPLVYLGALVIGALLQGFVLPVRVGLPRELRWVLALVAAGLGIAVMAAAIGWFRRTGQDPKPWKATPEIISTGVYGLTRNPMYVGMALLQLGIGLAAANGWILAALPVVLWIVYATAIRHEEAYLTAKFGAAYTDYKASVRRWL